MKMTKQITAIILLSFLFSLFSCNAYQDVEMLKVDLKSIGDIKNDNVTINLAMEVNNPNGYNIKIKKSTFDLFIEGDKIGEAHMTDDILLKKRTQDVYPFSIKTNYKSLVASITKKSLQIILGKSHIDLRLKGKVKAKVYGLGKKFDVDVTEKLDIKELMKKVGL